MAMKGDACAKGTPTSQALHFIPPSTIWRAQPRKSLSYQHAIEYEPDTICKRSRRDSKGQLAKICVRRRRQATVSCGRLANHSKQFAIATHLPWSRNLPLHCLALRSYDPALVTAVSKVSHKIALVRTRRTSDIANLQKDSGS